MNQQKKSITVKTIRFSLLVLILMFTLIAGTQLLSSQDVIVSLDEEQIHTGDLILVNASHAYDFTANETTIQLVNLAEHQSVYYPVDKEEFQISQRILPHLDEMIQDCNTALGVADTSISSAYRSQEYQQQVYDETAAAYGADYADQYVSAPGYSEHHTGLAVDLGITDETGAAGSFSDSENALWMDENAHHHGFIRRYTEDKTAITGISNEAWHFRYVGYAHANYMKANNLALEEYLELLRTSATQEEPMSISTDQGTYNVYYTNETTLINPPDDYEISGDNDSGYIITWKETF